MSYNTRAEFWDCFFGDRTEEIRFWSQLSRKYGRNILALMAATGEVAEGLAKSGLLVTAVDICAEMVESGQRRAKNLPSLSFIQADVTALSLGQASFDFACFGTGDFHHFLDLKDQLAALKSVNRCIRNGGGLALELFPFRTESKTTPRQRFYPFRPPAQDDIVIWKDSESSYDADTRLFSITQMMHIERPGQPVEEFTFNVLLRLFDKNEVSSLLNQSGFKITREYGDYDFTPYTPGALDWIILAEKTREL